jgi:phosphohistidine phosphatase SixA
MAADNHLDIAMTTQLDDETGEPRVQFRLARIDHEKQTVQEVGHVTFVPTEAHLFAVKLMHAALDVQFYASTIAALRSHKIPEEDINKIIREIDTQQHARSERDTK